MRLLGNKVANSLGWGLSQAIPFSSSIQAKNKATARLHYFLVPEEGLEPSIPKECDFESHAYTNSATPARMTVEVSIL